MCQSLETNGLVSLLKSVRELVTRAHSSDNNCKGSLRSLSLNNMQMSLDYTQEWKFKLEFPNYNVLSVLLQLYLCLEVLVKAGLL